MGMQGGAKGPPTAVLVRPNALVSDLPCCVQHADVGVFDNLQLVLLVGLEVLVEGIAGQLDGLGNQAGEIHGDPAHPLYVLGEDGPEVGQHVRRRPLVWCEQVVVPRRIRARGWVLGRDVDLLTVVDGTGSDFG